jgi:formyltetrahydrofolate hydrolase
VFLYEGPIIEQDVLRVSHSDSVQEMQKMGQDIEKVTLAKGLQYHLEDRVLTIKTSYGFSIIIINSPTLLFFTHLRYQQ